MLWVNTPGNPAGQLDDLARRPRRGAGQRGVLVLSDECYAEFTWAGPPGHLSDKGGAPSHDGVLAVHSLSKRSNLAGPASGWYAGDADLVELPAGGAQARRVDGARTGAAAGVAALADQEPRRASSGSATGSVWCGWPQILGAARASRSTCPMAGSTVGAGARR